MAATNSYLTVSKELCDTTVNHKTVNHKTVNKLNNHIYLQSSSAVSLRARHQDFTRLRHRVAVLDGAVERPRMSFGVDGLDSALGGGLALGRVHMLCATMAASQSALTGFVLCLLRQLLAQPEKTGPIVWCPAAPRGPTGMLYGAGLAALGLDPGRLLVVDAPSPTRRLAVLEDILRTTGVAAVVAEYESIQQSADYWMRLARRTQLAAEASGTTGFLLGWPGRASGFESLWHVAPACVRVPGCVPGCVTAPQDWRSVWDVELKQARGGRPHNVRLVWDPIDNRLNEMPMSAPALPAPALPVEAPQLPLHSGGTIPQIISVAGIPEKSTAPEARPRLVG